MIRSSNWGIKLVFVVGLLLFIVSNILMFVSDSLDSSVAEDIMMVQMMGTFFMFVSSMFLFFGIRWLKSLIIFVFSSWFLVVFIINKLYYGGFLFALIIFGIFWFASVMDLILNFKNKDFNPIQDIKNEIAISKEIKLLKKMNMTLEEKEIKRQKRELILIGIGMMSTLFIYVIIASVLVIPEIINNILMVIVCLGTFIGFFVISLTLVYGDNVSKNNILEEIKNIMVTILVVLPVFLVIFGIIVLLFTDPFNFFDNFSNPMRVQIYSLFTFICVVNTLYVKKKNLMVRKKEIVIYIIVNIIMFLLGYYITMPESGMVNKLSYIEFKINDRVVETSFR